MKSTTRIFFFLAILLFIFGYWGYFTFNGRLHFDEMDGMIPFFALVASGLSTAICIVLVLVQKLKK